MKRLVLMLLLLPAARADDRAIWPFDNPSFEKQGFKPSTDDRLISGVFGPRLMWGSSRYDHHEGFDLFAFYDPKHQDGHVPVKCILPGVVSEIIDPPDPERVETGRKVVVTHELAWSKLGAPAAWGPIKSGYLHLTTIDVQQGQRLKAGDLVGSAGETGHTSTVHLHLNVYRAGGGRAVNVNPARIYRPKDFPRAVAPLDAKTVEVEWLERDAKAGTVLARVLLPYNAYTMDGFTFVIDGDDSRTVSFEAVSASPARDKRDTGHESLFPKLRVFPLRYNGGGAIDRVNAKDTPPGWPAARFPVPGGKGVRLGWDVLATDVPAKAKKIALVVHGVEGEKVEVPLK